MLSTERNLYSTSAMISVRRAEIGRRLGNRDSGHGHQPKKPLRCAQRAAYAERSLLNVTPAQLDAYFERTKQGFNVKPRIKRMVSFAQMNLAESPYVGKDRSHRSA